MTISLFRYSGNKGRLLGLYRSPPKLTTRIVEPYLGSGAYSLNHDLPAIGFDINPMVVDLWHWLQHISPQDLNHLNEVFESFKEKLDIRELPLTRGEMLFLKINVCGIYVGQWSSWTLYPQHKLPVEKTLQALSHSRRVQVCRGDAQEYSPQRGDVVFLDPPYAGTKGNYPGEGSYNPEDTMNLLQRLSSLNIPVIFTYGNEAKQTFPKLPWEVVLRKKVPNIRRGGLVERTEHVCYLNWPEEPSMDILSLFKEGNHV